MEKKLIEIEKLSKEFETLQFENLSLEQTRKLSDFIINLKKGSGQTIVTHKNIFEITQEDLIITLDSIDFFVPTNLGLLKNKKLDQKNLNFLFNKTGLVGYGGLYSLEKQISYFKTYYEIDPEKIVILTKNQILKLLENKSLRETLIKNNIIRIPFLIDLKNENRNISVIEYIYNQNTQKSEYLSEDDLTLHFGIYNIEKNTWFYENPVIPASVSALFIGIIRDIKNN